MARPATMIECRQPKYDRRPGSQQADSRECRNLMQAGKGREEERRIADRDRGGRERDADPDAPQALTRRAALGGKDLSQILKAVIDGDADEAYAEQQRHDMELAEQPETGGK